MQGRVQTQKRGARRYRCRKCGRSATFVLRGKRKGDEEHDLCRRCFEKAELEGRERARALGIPCVRRRP